MPARAEIRYPIEHTKTEPISNVAIYLPGQDVRRTGMFNDLIGNDPAGLEVIMRADRYLKLRYGYEISEIVAKKELFDTLRRSEYTQAAVFTLSVALHNKLKYQGKDGFATLPAIITGNSMAMVTAAYLSGAIEGFETALDLAVMRGRTMEEHGDKRHTSMFAVKTPRARVDQLIAPPSLLDLCLINGPELFVLGGPDQGENNPVEKAKEELKQEKIRVFPLDVAMAQHGRYVRPAKGEFCNVLDTIKFKKPLMKVVGTKNPNEPINTAQGIIDELEYGFDNTFDNWAICQYLGKSKIHVIYEVNEKGTMVKIMAFAALGVIVGTAAVGFVEFWTRSHPGNKH